MREYNEKTTANNPLEENVLYAKVAQSSDGETCIAICDPFQRRVHKMMMDATSNVDRSGTNIFHLMCPSSAGGLPIATPISTREDNKTIQYALELLKSILPSYAFYGRGPNVGPVLALTDDSDSEQMALSAAWPDLVLLLCQFHLLQALWQWLWPGAHKIEKGDRAPLLQLFRKLVYSDTEELFKKAVAEMKSTLSTKSIHPLKHTSSKMYSLERIVGHFFTGSMKGYQHLLLTQPTMSKVASGGPKSTSLTAIGLIIFWIYSK